MKNFYLKRVLSLLFLTLLFFAKNSFSQTTISTEIGTTGYTYANGVTGATAVVSFVVENTNAYPINLETVTIAKGTSLTTPATFKLWYSSTSLSGVAVIATPTWTLHSTNAAPINLVAGYGNTIFSNLALLIPASTTYRFFVESNNGISYSGSGVGNCTPNILNAGGVNLMLGDAAIPSSSTTYVGYAGNTLSPTNNPRWFTGSITFSPAAACTNPINGGTTTSNVNPVCATNNFILGLTGASVGTGITYQWDSSSNGTTWFPILSATLNSLSKTQLSSSYYRCNITCSGGTTVQSAPLLVTSPLLIPGSNFTIDKGNAASATNFQTFADAINYIRCGISGPINFTVAPNSGPYVERVNIPQINGTSSTNKITFNGNGNTVSFVNTTTTDRTFIALNGADHIVIDSLIIDATGVSSTGFAWGIGLTGQADSNIIRKCTVNIGNLLATSTINFFGIVMNGSLTGVTAVSANNGNNNQFLNNTINGGSNGFYLWGNVGFPTQNIGNIISGNTINDFFGNGVIISHMANAVITNNDIKRNNRTNSTTVYGVNLNTGTINALVEKNRIHNLFDAMPTATSLALGVFVAADATLGSENKIYNNAIYGMNGNGTQYGIQNSGADFVNIYHNTIVLDNAAATGIGYGIYQTTAASGIRIKNNLISVSKGGTAAKRCLMFNTNTSAIVSNNNVLHLDATTGTDNRIAQWGTSNYTTLTDWQAANTNSFDQGSISINPNFTNILIGDFTPQEPSINGIGDNVNITTDILGMPRTANPDPGAFEFSLGPCTNPTEAGIATSSAINICANVNFTLGLSGNSIGSGINYQWQRTTDSTNRNSWVNVGVVQALANFSISQTDTFYYRCIASCGMGLTDTSSMIKVITNPLPIGNFTINKTLPSGGTNFASFNDAVSYISCGIGGPVTFTVTQGTGPYVEQVTIPQILGRSSTNTVTFKGNLETLQFVNTTTTDRHILRLNGADFVTIDSLNIDASSVASTGFAWGIVLMNTADSNIIKNCTVNIGNLASTSTTNFLAFVINGSSSTTATSGNNGSGNQILNNTFIGGGGSLYLYGNSGITTQNSGNIISGNTITDFHGNGISTTYMPNTIIRGNDIKRNNRGVTTTAYGISLATGTINALVEKNRIHNLFDAMPSSTTASAAINITSDATVGNENKIYNNAIYAMNGNGLQYGILNSGSDFVNIYHNTISLDDATATLGATYGIHQATLATGVNIKNNIVSVSRGGTGIKRCLNFTTNTSSIASNNNVLFMNSSGGTDNKIGAWGTTSYNLLSEWNLAKTPRFDSLSISLDPSFVDPNNGNLQFTTNSIDGIGENVGVTRDINDSARGVTPDPGCFEINYLVAGIDMKAETLVSPAIAPNSCYTGSETVTVLIKNNSTTTINFVTNPATVTTQVIGAATQTLTRVINTGTLASNSTLAVPMSATLNMSANGAYSLLGSVAVVGDVNAANNAFSEAAIREKITINAGSVLASPNQVCAVTTTQPRLTATGLLGYNSLQWQQSTAPSTGFTNIATATSNSYTITAPITQTMYYRLQASCDVAQANSAEDTILYVNPTITSTTPRFTCGTGSVKLDATASAGSTVRWYAAVTGGSPLSIGERFNTPSISVNTTYYAAAGLGSSNNTGKQIYTPNPSSGSGVTNFGLVFDALTAFTLKSVVIYPVSSTSAAGSVTVDVINSSGSVVGTGTYNVTGSPTSAPIAQLLNLNFEIPAGTNYKLRPASITGITGILFDPAANAPAGNHGYPYVVPGVLSINTSTLSASPGNAARNDLYYYFYDWMISTGCESPRVPVLATVDNSPGCTPLPITLLSFTGVKLGNVNKLDWITSSEVNSKGFYVERSIDGNKFSSIGYIASKSDNGTSTQNIAYSFIDEKPLIGNNYYRIKQVDKDGIVSYTNIIVLKSANIKQVEINGIYPNPASNVLNISMVSPVAEKMSFLITDLQGKLLFQQNEMLQLGTNNYSININQLSAGNYLIKASCSKGCETKTFKFVKL